MSKYGSLIAGYASQVKAGSLLDSGLDVSQFIATGDAANNLAKKKQVQHLFEAEARAALQAAAIGDLKVFTNEIDVVIACVQTDAGVFDTGARDRLIGAALADGGINSDQATRLIAASSDVELRSMLTGLDTSAAEPLAKAAAAHGGACV